MSSMVMGRTVALLDRAISTVDHLITNSSFASWTQSVYLKIQITKMIMDKHSICAYRLKAKCMYPCVFTCLVIQNAEQPHLRSNLP